MLEKMFDLFGWTNGQILRFSHFTNYMQNLFSAQIPFRRVFSALLAAVELFCAAAFKTPVHPYGEELNLDGYDLVVYDEFDGDELNADLWYNRGVGARRFGYNAASQVQVRDGSLIITGEYRDENSGEYGEGWYAGAIALKEWYCKGYFEIRCICNKDEGFWSAFWIQSSHSYDAQSNGGIGGAEIDIFEAAEYDALLKSKRNSVTQTVYCNGWDSDPDEIDKCQFSAIGNDIYNEYNTYGLKWTDDEYIFYINGVETGRTSFGLGVSQVLENLIVSLELPEELPEKITSDKNYKTEFIVDYVKVYQQSN
ncbi:MAG: glycoside hydrolase family 16 protein [Clostridia bacterium]|nr:glycoside hydrolase family 16 protein [Clostridia bacterium]